MSLFSGYEIGINRSIQQHVCSKDIVNTPPVFKGQCIMAPCVLVVSMSERVVGGQRYSTSSAAMHLGGFRKNASCGEIIAVDCYRMKPVLLTFFPVHTPFCSGPTGRAKLQRTCAS